MAKAAAEATGQPLYRYVGGVAARTLPVPFMNIVNGGAHADNTLDPQEFMIVPHGAPTFAEALRMGVEVFHHLKAILKKKGHGHRRWATRAASRPTCKSSEEALETILDAIRAAGYKAGSADLAGPRRGGQRVPRGQEVRLQEVGRRGQDLRSRWSRCTRQWVKAYPIVSIEDGVGEKDWAGWKALTEALGAKVQLVGDDLFVTNPEILARGIAEGIANSVLVKVNQIGTLTETLDCVALAVARGLHLHDEPPQRRDRGRDHRRPRGGHRTAGRSRPAPPRAPTAWRSTTSSCASRRSSGPWRRFAGRSALNPRT